MVDVKQKGDWVVFKYQRPSHWSKDGSMDKWLGKRVQITSTYPWSNGNGKFWFEGGPIDKEFLFSDINPYGAGDYHTVGAIKPYALPIQDAMKALEPPKKWEPQLGELVLLVLPVKVIRDLGNGTMDVYSDNGNALTVSKISLQKHFLQSNNQFTMKAMKDAVSTVAKSLLKANNTVTTLEIKAELRRDYPYYFWTQQVVSDYMSQLAGDGVFDYTDNGTYRTYFLAGKPTNQPLAQPKSAIRKSVHVSLPSGIAKVSGTVSSQPAKKRGRPRKIATTFSKSSLNQAQALGFAALNTFEKAEFKNGRVISLNEIRRQKKSAVGYLQSKIHNVAKITVAGITYDVV